MKHLAGKKILYAFSTIDYAKLWQKVHFIDELKHYNVETILFNSYIYQEISKYQLEIIDFVKKHQSEISFFITADTGKRIYPETLNELRKLNIPSILLCYDNLSMPYLHQNICKYFDVVWITSRETEGLFKKWGANTIFMPYAANPYMFYPQNVNEIESVGFIGSIYGARGHKLNQIAYQNIPLNLYTGYSLLTNQKRKMDKTSILNEIRELVLKSSKLIRFHEGRLLLKADIKKSVKTIFSSKERLHQAININNSPTFEEMNLLYSKFALSLGIIETWNTYLLKNPLFKIHLRTFEIPMCGGLQIVNRTDELREYFEEDKEILLYGSEEEMIDKMKYYLSPDRSKVRLKMKKAARARSEADHTWLRRFEKIENIIF